MKIWKITSDSYHTTDQSNHEPGTMGVGEPNRTGTWGDAGSVYPFCNGTDRGGIGSCPLTDDDMPIEFGLFAENGAILYMGRMTKELADSIFARAPLEQFGKPFAEAAGIRIRNPRPQPILDERGGVLDNDEWFEIH